MTVQKCTRETRQIKWDKIRGQKNKQNIQKTKTKLKRDVDRNKDRKGDRQKDRELRVSAENKPTETHI